MSGDWIKMRRALQSHPKVVRILSATGADKFRVVGGLHAVWCVFDEHSEDGALKGYTPELLDHIIGWEGFSRAMESVGWLLFDGMETLTLPEFTEHNGQSAKRRAEDQKRKRDSRKCPQSVQSACGQNADTVRTREEKRREEHKAASATPEAFRADLFRRWKALDNGGGGAFLNKLFRDHGEQPTLEAVERTLDHGPADPKAFVHGLLRKQKATVDAVDDILRGAI